ncbi:type I-E CRISPR-associated protein Cas6/Cse3/CasE [Allostella vacuolata]|nr:type I-E CRISPR-associated protein Cas6/Cse3/CasE [Stella vacuolata]
MTEAPLFLSRIALSRQVSAAALAPLVLPAADGARAGAPHHLLWSLFADSPERTRDFLWREEDAGRGWQGRRFLTLSRRLPVDRHALFELESQEFAPRLQPGDRLRFQLRANPSVAQSQPGRGRSKRIDPLAAALSPLDPAQRKERRQAITEAVGRAWLEGHAQRAGFRLPPESEARLTVDGDAWRTLPRGDQAPIRFSMLDFEGTLVVEDPALFLTRLAQGFGPQKTFGCGLMLIRRG